MVGYLKKNEQAYLFEMVVKRLTDTERAILQSTDPGLLKPLGESFSCVTCALRLEKIVKILIKNVS